jgi:hypothetical protein
MGGKSEKSANSLVDQLAAFDSRVAGKIDDVSMLAEIQSAIGRLLAENAGSEAQIRRVLQDRFDAGTLRKETFQLVKSMLDRYVTEYAPTSPEMPRKGDGRLEPHIGGATPRIPDSAPTPSAPVPKSSMRQPVGLPGEPIVNATAAGTGVQVGTVLRDRFLLQEQVAGEGMGVVFRAIDRRLVEAGADETNVAIKVLSPQLSENELAVRALQQEAAKGRCLVQPNIVRFIDFDRDGDLNFIVMEWLQGRTLADILDSPDSKVIDTDRAFRIVRQVGKALEYAHQRGIVHADVKPGNIMILPNGDAKLFDFGVARMLQKQRDQDPAFDPGVLGLMTPAYSSMQVLTGEKPVPADDVFSLACLLYRLLAGYRVFGPRNAAEAADAGMKPQRIEKLSEANWRVLNKALSYARVTRFQSMEDFLDALDVEAAESITVDIPVPDRFAGNAGERRGVGRALFGLILLAGLSGVVANQLGLLDSMKAQYLPQLLGSGGEEPIVESINEPAAEPLQQEPEAVIEAPVAAENTAKEQVVEVASSPAEDGVIVAGVPDEGNAALPVAEEVVAVSAPAAIPAPVDDFSRLPPPTAELILPGPGGQVETVTVRLREDGRRASVDIVRRQTSFPLTLKLEEAGYTGNRSPWVSNQYQFSDSGYLEFPVGQDRARVSIEMTSDQLREPDQQVTLRIRESESSTLQLATINVILEDDDQRRYEATLPADTVAFGVSQVTINESSPAVQLDVMRFNPSDTPLTASFELRDITATQGEDYFAPGNTTIEFGPGQRVTRLLIPLVQDSEYENNEAFSIELSSADSVVRADVYRRVAVLIRDDDQ